MEQISFYLKVLRDSITFNSGDNTIKTSGQSASVHGGPGQLNMTDTGDHTMVDINASDATIHASGNAAIIFGGSGRAELTVSGSNETVVGSSGAISVSSSSNALVYGGTGALSFIGSDGIATILGIVSGGTENVTVALGGAVVAVELRQ